MDSSEKRSDSKRLAKNTLMLYCRTLIIMCIGFFTSRVILQSLGVDDYGIYNVVGGFVGMFSIITNTLVATTQRYITVELGKGDAGNPKKMFGVVLSIHIGLAILMTLVFETFGLYFLNYKLVIPPERLYAANWIFQISVLTSVLGLFSTPYMGIIVSHERMGAFAFISMQDAILRLVICYILYISDSDRLIIYASLLGLVSIWNQFLYMRYCHTHFYEVKTRPLKDRYLFKSVFGFAGMNFLGSFAWILSTEGITVMLNMFFGVAVNAARGIAIQVQNMVGRFTGDFMTALNPQIIKEYSGGEKEKSLELVIRGAKFSYLIVLILAIPIIIRASQLLSIWLDSYPKYTVEFVQLTLALSLINVISNPYVTINLASGKIKDISIWIGGVRLFTLPLVYACLRFFDSPLYAYYILIIIEMLLFFIRIKIMDIVSKISISKTTIKKLIIPVVITTPIALFVAYKLDDLFSPSFNGLVLYLIFTCLTIALISYFILLNSPERNFVLNQIKQMFQHIKSIS